MTDERKNCIEPDGSTTLHAATYFGHQSIVKWLLEYGCATWILNKYNNTPYDDAQNDKLCELSRRADRNDESSRFASVDDYFGVVARGTAANS